MPLIENAHKFSFAPRLCRITFSFSSIYRRWLFQICLSAWFCIHTPACFFCRRAICDALFLREINIPVSISQPQQQGRSRSSKKKQRSVCRRRHIVRQLFTMCVIYFSISYRIWELGGLCKNAYVKENIGSTFAATTQSGLARDKGDFFSMAHWLLWVEIEILSLSNLTPHRTAIVRQWL